MDFKSDWGTCGILLAGVVGLSALLLSPVRLPAQGDPGHVHLAAATKDDVGIHALAVVVLTNRPMEHHCFTNATISFPDGTGGPGWGCQDIYHLVAIDSVAGMFENGTVQEAFPAADWDPINTPAGVTHLTNGQWSMPTPGQFTAPLFDDVLMAVTSQDPGDADVDWYKYKQVWSIIQVKQNADGTYPPNALPGGAAAKPITLNSHACRWSTTTTKWAGQRCRATNSGRMCGRSATTPRSGSSQGSANASARPSRAATKIAAVWPSQSFSCSSSSLSTVSRSSGSTPPCAWLRP